jgi:stage III sporulation protein AC
LGAIYRYFPIRKDFPMDISLIIKVAGVGILVSVATQILSKSGRDEQSMLVTLTGIVVVLLLLVDEIALLFDSICAVFGF